jgi:MFS family permease
MSDAPSAHATIVPAGATCVRCGYDVGGLTRALSCSECGTPVSQSVAADLLRDATADAVRRLARGLVAFQWAVGIAAATACAVVVLLLVTRFIMVFSNAVAWRTFFPVIFIVASAGALVSAGFGLRATSQLRGVLSVPGVLTAAGIITTIALVLTIFGADTRAAFVIDVVLLLTVSMAGLWWYVTTGVFRALGPRIPAAYEAGSVHFCMRMVAASAGSAAGLLVVSELLLSLIVQGSVLQNVVRLAILGMIVASVFYALRLIPSVARLRRRVLAQLAD